MTRISENQVNRAFLTQMIRNREDVNKFGEELSSGYKVSEPGDSKQSATIAQFRDMLTKIQGYQKRVDFTEGFLVAQDNVLAESTGIMVRAQEIATQGANETVGAQERASLAQEVYELRDHLVSLANTTYQGRYIYSGAADDQPAFSRGTDYTIPGTGGYADTHHAYNNNPGAQQTRDVAITDSLNITVNTPGDQVFSTAVYALERLGRALEGYRTAPAAPAIPDPTDPGNTAYVFPTDYDQQTADITEALDLLHQSREQDILPERASLGGKMRRLDTARSLLELSEATAEEVLSKLQDADVAESASNLAQAQSALEASYVVTNRLLNLSILDYI